MQGTQFSYAKAIGNDASRQADGGGPFLLSNTSA